MVGSHANFFAKRLLTAAATAFLLAAGGGIGLTAAVQPAFAADLTAAKAAVDAAKASGSVGEQGDGFLGFVRGSADSATTAAVEAINAGRKQVYASTAAKTGVSPEAAGEATAKVLFAKMPAGQYYKPLGGSWTKK
ncbi:MAG: YdbL family protein [Alphaproteobacteria bacterium]|nr:YdbL family protein [Alphaproteobacteria bacterium]